MCNALSFSANISLFDGEGCAGILVFFAINGTANYLLIARIYFNFQPHFFDKKVVLACRKNALLPTFVKQR